MPSALDIFGTVFKNDSVILMARVVGDDGLPITKATISSIEYTVYLLNEANPDTLTPVTGHTSVAVTVGDTLYDVLQIDELWDADTEGYNFKHVLDVSSNQAFVTAGVYYQVRFTLTPASGQDIIIRFKVKAI